MPVNVQARPLGGGTTPVDAAAAAIAATQTGSQEAARAGRDAQDALQRATRAIQAMQAGQQAARDAARLQPGGVPNGLAPGGLQIGAGVVRPDTTINPQLWQGARLPTEVAQADRVKVNIDQTQQKAILTWDTFNVGARTDLRFNQQGNRDWVALNQVLGADARPSQILGSITADGSVYVINQNGIVFGATSQVNVGSLIASTATISNDQFLTKGIYSTQTGSTFTPSFTEAAALVGTVDGGGRIKVEAGAVIATNAPSSVTSGGGFVLLLGSQVENAGSISTPRGQTQLAAGDDFILRRGYGTETNAFSTTRGNEIVPVFAEGSLSGGVANSGMIFSQQGDITLAGRTIAQNGVLISTTSVNNRGTVHLLNSASDTAGRIVLGANSLTQVLPELDSNETALDGQRDSLIDASKGLRPELGAFDNLSTLADRLDRSRIEIVTGGDVTFKGRSLNIAQGGQIAVSAGRRIVTETGATLDVSGVRDVALPMSANNILVNIQGNELRDSPVNRDGSFLKNANVWIDVRDLVLVPSGTGGYDGDRYYTPGGLLEVGGYLANTAHRIGEWAALGGTITLSAPEVIARAGSRFDLSGGSIAYQAGAVRTSNFFGRDGRAVNIANTRGDTIYYGLGQGFVVEHARWGVTEIYTSPLSRGRMSVRFEDGYTVGRDAGRLVLSTPTALFEGDILAGVVTGARQTNARPEGVTDGYKLGANTVALDGQLSLGRYDAVGLVGAYNSDVRIGDIANSAASAGLNKPLPSDRLNTVWFDAGRLNEQRLGGLDIYTSNAIAVESNLELAHGGSLTLTAPTIDISANIAARGGSVTVTNVIRPTGGTSPAPSALIPLEGRAQATLHAGAAIDTSGLFTNLLAKPSDVSGQAYLNSGDVRIVVAGDVSVETGSRIDVSSGGAILANGKTKGGKGGDISLIAGDISVSNSLGGRLLLGGVLRGYGVNGGGTLKLAGESVRIANAAGGDAPGELLLTPDFFRVGFSAYDITGYGGVVVADGVKVDVIQPVYRFREASYAMPGGADPAGALEVWTPPLHTENPATGVLTRRGGASLSLTAGYPGQNSPITIGTGAVVSVDPGQSIKILGSGQITVNGTLNAWSGAITIADAAQIGSTDPDPNRSIRIGDSAVLDVAGRAFTALDDRGRTYGLVGDGGAISLGIQTPAGSSAPVVTGSFVLIRPGARLDASGSAAMLDMPAANNLAASPQPVLVAGKGGSIAFGSANGIEIDGDIRAASGGGNAAGGSLSLLLETPTYTDAVDPAARIPRSLIVTQARRLSPDADLVFGEARISAEQVQAGGFGNLTLYSRDLIRFEGDVNLSLGQSLTLQRGILSVADTTPNARVSLAAPYVVLDGMTPLQISGDSNFFYPGIDLSGGWFPSVRTADARLSVTADLIDVRNDVEFGVSARYQIAPAPSFDLPPVYAPIDARGFATVDLVSRGDIRFGNSNVRSSGDIALTAARIYPVTGVEATVSAGLKISANGGFSEVGPDGRLTIRGTGVASEVPYSVFGRLSLNAGTVDQGGAVYAPLGVLSLGRPSFDVNFGTRSVVLRSGSITSVSAEGLTLPYGGTVDGLRYLHNGQEIAPPDLLVLRDVFGKLAQGVSIGSARLVAEPGSVVDLSGGGVLTGAGFISGRGGSVNVLWTPLVNANPGNGYSAPGNKVYAIVPGYASGYAPLAPDNGAGDPAVGQQITLTSAAGGLPAGTYTLLPSTYALLPGAYRIEIGGNAKTALTTAVNTGAGSYLTAGYLGVANTGIRASLPSQVIVTSAATVRTYSNYNETDYSAFAVAKAGVFGVQRPRLPVDGKSLLLDFGGATGETLQFEGEARFNSAPGGFGGTLAVIANKGIEIKPGGTPASTGLVSLDAEDLSNFAASTLVIGGTYNYTGVGTLLGPRVVFSGQSNQIVVRSNAKVTAGQIFLVANDIAVESGAILDTTGSATDGVDSRAGYVYATSFTDSPDSAGALLAVANGQFNFLPTVATANSRISVADGAVLRTLGTIAFAAGESLDLGVADLNARYVTMALPAVNIGSAESLAAAEAAGVLRPGWKLTQDTLNNLLRPRNPALAGLESLTLSVRESINFFGSVTLDATSPHAGNPDVTLVLNTPAFYGKGGAGDTATIRADTLVWNGVATGLGETGSPYVSVAPSPVLPGGAGTGTGALNIDARIVTFGYDALGRPQNQISLDRLALGFGSVDIRASERITANNRGSLSVYTSGTDTASYAGGDLRLTTPLLTTEAGGVMAYRAGGTIVTAAPQGIPATNPRGINELGGDITLSGASVVLDTAVALPSGRLTINALGDITLGANAAIDLAGREIKFFDVTKYSWGGDVILSSASGSIRQSAGSFIDVSARNNDAGTIEASAIGAGGRVVFGGALRGGSTGDYASGGFDLRVDAIDDFAGLNTRLTDAGFFGARSFDIRTGDLVVGNEVRANRVNISVDGGSLTVTGRIDASGDRVGTIRLSARDSLILTGTAVLDAHGSRLVTDSYGQPIEASNRASVELTASDPVTGMVVLSPGATIDLRVPDNVARGKLEINAPRRGGDDIAVEASGPLDIRGAASIALNGFRRYELPDGGVIDQAYLDALHGDNAAFIDAVEINGALQARIAGLSSYGSAFHLRPGVEIRSDGSLSTDRDLDFAAFRYGPNANVASLGAGEPGVFVVRAAGDFTIKGSITDGFAPPPLTPDDNGWRRQIEGQIGSDYTVTDPITLSSATFRPGDYTLNFDLPVRAPYLLDRVAIPFAFETSDQVFATGWVARADIRSADGTLLYSAGQTVNVQLPAGTRFSPGTVLPYALTVADLTIPAGSLMNFFVVISLNGSITLPTGAVLPAGSFASASGETRTAGPDGRQGAIYALAPMLAPGAQSWSMRLVAGADLAAADTRVLRPASDRAGRGNLVLDDEHYAGPDGLQPAISVIRTGTGYLDLLAAGDYRHNTLFGVYTAGTAVAGTDAYDLPRAKTPDGTVLASYFDPAYEAAIGAKRMWFTEGGGDLLVQARGSVNGRIFYSDRGAINDIGDWMWRQGGSELGQLTAWGVNFGSYVMDPFVGLRLSGFTGIGTLGGGNVTVNAGGDAGVLQTVLGDALQYSTGGLAIAVAGSGRVSADGQLTQTGGGDLTLTVGGRVNPGLITLETGAGYLVNLRGDTAVKAGAIGQKSLQGYGVPNTSTDPRPADLNRSYQSTFFGSLLLLPGDGGMTIATRSDLVVRSIFDPGLVPVVGAPAASYDGMSGESVSWFSLWTDRTRVDLISAGGVAVPSLAATGVTSSYYPSKLSVVAAGGSVLFATNANNGLSLLPSATGQLEILARDTINSDGEYGLFGGYIAVSGGAARNIATPFRPAWAVNDPSVGGFVATNFWGGLNSTTTESTPFYDLILGGAVFAFGPDTVLDNLHAGDSNPIRIYAMQGDIYNLSLGNSRIFRDRQGNTTAIYAAAKPAWLRAGSDIVNTTGLLFNNNVNDVSILSAGRDVIYSNFDIAGPGTLEVTAGRSIYQANRGTLTSIGPIVPGDSRPGASIVMQAGAGPNGPDYARLVALYLDPANLANPSVPLADQSGKVAKTYETELTAWLSQRYGFAGSTAQALAAFNALPAEQQRVFLRQVYFAELREGGREYNNPRSSRFGSYLRGREMIATLFPEQDAGGNDVAYRGDITIFGGSGVRTLFGGDIQALVPGGQIIVGVEGQVPPATAGLVTQGAGNIQLYSQGSILLGLSRILTTFGGDVFAWSAEGDINAGRGAKTTVLYTPPKRTYDDYGNVTLAPNVPSSGAGIATLNPIPEVPAGDIDLIAPLGTIDAGEAGIRSSGNVNLAALQIVNAANIQAQGTTTGVPVVQAPNVAGLTEASNSAGAAAKQATTPAQPEANAQPSVIIVEVLGFGGGDGDATIEQQRKDEEERRKKRADLQGQDPRSPVQVIGAGSLSSEQRNKLTPTEQRNFDAP